MDRTADCRIKTQNLAHFSGSCSADFRRGLERAEMTAITVSHGETVQRRRAEKTVRRLGLRRRPTAPSDRMETRPGSADGVASPSESGGARRFATAVEPRRASPFVSVPPFLCVMTVGSGTSVTSRARPE